MKREFVPGAGLRFEIEPRELWDMLTAQEQERAIMEVIVPEAIQEELLYQINGEYGPSRNTLVLNELRNLIAQDSRFVHSGIKALLTNLLAELMSQTQQARAFNQSFWNLFYNRDNPQVPTALEADKENWRSDCREVACDVLEQFYKKTFLPELDKAEFEGTWPGSHLEITEKE